MDAGLAAVCGALAGSVATIGAALATGWSQRETARISARAEHQRQRHEARHAAYKALISATQTLNSVTRGMRHDPQLRDFTPEIAEACAAAESDIKEVWLEVVLAGPQNAARAANAIMHSANVMKTATEVIARIQSFQHVGQALTEPTVRDFIQSFTKAAARLPEETGRFVDAAHESLSDDGASAVRN
ncbi:hypothetical protein SSP24_81180 [Streptomyces spinoverrucosus]|uniref:Uncharacterized protein n=1 Tax=Streptomyces spinoverrucosus TaxID=284043 RepID=A0A4Y3VUZ3_9ACTN|nr:hypothetical protein SSP24_81180 [Streptomyces spinoverrucosus]GHB91870.1 hypothetical protein GCM10010397_75450 [Streptomyces spinoverrucosus]